jgi:hypothetical protein
MLPNLFPAGSALHDAFSELQQRDVLHHRAKLAGESKRGLRPAGAESLAQPSVVASDDGGGGGGSRRHAPRALLQHAGGVVERRGMAEAAPLPAPSPSQRRQQQQQQQQQQEGQAASSPHGSTGSRYIPVSEIDFVGDPELPYLPQAAQARSLGPGRPIEGVSKAAMRERLLPKEQAAQFHFKQHLITRAVRRARAMDRESDEHAGMARDEGYDPKGLTSALGVLGGFGGGLGGGGGGGGAGAGADAAAAAAALAATKPFETPVGVATLKRCAPLVSLVGDLQRVNIAFDGAIEAAAGHRKELRRSLARVRATYLSLFEQQLAVTLHLHHTHSRAAHAESVLAERHVAEVESSFAMLRARALAAETSAAATSALLRNAQRENAELREELAELRLVEQEAKARHHADREAAMSKLLDLQQADMGERIKRAEEERRKQHMREKAALKAAASRNKINALDRRYRRSFTAGAGGGGADSPEALAAALAAEEARMNAANEEMLLLAGGQRGGGGGGVPGDGGAPDGPPRNMSTQTEVADDGLWDLSGGVPVEVTRGVVTRLMWDKLRNFCRCAFCRGRFALPQRGMLVGGRQQFRRESIFKEGAAVAATKRAVRQVARSGGGVPRSKKAGEWYVPDSIRIFMANLPRSVLAAPIRPMAWLAATANELYDAKLLADLEDDRDGVARQCLSDFLLGEMLRRHETRQKAELAVFEIIAAVKALYRATTLVHTFARFLELLGAVTSGEAGGTDAGAADADADAADELLLGAAAKGAAKRRRSSGASSQSRASLRVKSKRKGGKKGGKQGDGDKYRATKVQLEQAGLSEAGSLPPSCLHIYLHARDRLLKQVQPEAMQQLLAEQLAKEAKVIEDRSSLLLAARRGSKLPPSSSSSSSSSSQSRDRKASVGRHGGSPNGTTKNMGRRMSRLMGEQSTQALVTALEMQHSRRQSGRSEGGGHAGTPPAAGDAAAAAAAAASASAGASSAGGPGGVAAAAAAGGDLWFKLPDAAKDSEHVVCLDGMTRYVPLAHALEAFRASLSFLPADALEGYCRQLEQMATLYKGGAVAQPGTPGLRGDVRLIVRQTMLFDESKADADNKDYEGLLRGTDPDSVVVDVDLVLELLLEVVQIRVASLEGDLKKVFKAGDLNHDGVLSFDEFSAIVYCRAPHFSKRRCLRMFREALMCVAAANANASAANANANANANAAAAAAAAAASCLAACTPLTGACLLLFLLRAGPLQEWRQHQFFHRRGCVRVDLHESWPGLAAR